MLVKPGTIAFVACSTLCCGYIAFGQSGAATSNSAKQSGEALKKPPAAVVPDADGAKQVKQPTKKTSDAPKPGLTQAVVPDAVNTADEQAIRENISLFEKLYNAHDAKALSALFSPTAEMLDEHGAITKGRKAIEQQLSSVFKDTPATSMQIQAESIRIVTPTLAIEQGFTRSKDSPEDTEDLSAYTAIHVKSDGRWLLASVTDSGSTAQELTTHERLQELEWLVGEWIEESATSVVRTNCKWHDNGNFLMQEFSVQIGGQVAMSGTVRIGWDAVRKQFKSWVFDSHGGHAEGYWSNVGEQWIIKSLGATAAGEAAAATNIYQPVGQETILWSSVDRVTDGKKQENIDPITIKRRPPAPVQ